MYIRMQILADLTQFGRKSQSYQDNDKQLTIKFYTTEGQGEFDLGSA